MFELGFDPVVGSPYSGVGLSDLARMFSLELIGDDMEVRYQGGLDFHHDDRRDMLTYVVDKDFLPEFESLGIEMALIPEGLRASGLPEGRSYLVTREHPLDVFNRIHLYMVENRLYYQVEADVGSGCEISAKASIHKNVRIGDGCVIDDFVVIYPNTVVGDDVRIQAGSVIGGDGFEVKRMDGRLKILPHCGGTLIEDGAEICSLASVDRGLRHVFTAIGAGTKLSNQVQVGHGASLGEECIVAGHGQIANARIGRGVLISPSACIKPQITLGDYVFIGLGSVVLRSAPAHALLYGTPARHEGWACKCRGRIRFDEGGGGRCPRCGRSYLLSEDQVREVGPGE
jgi:serine acetyltransferase